MTEEKKNELQTGEIIKTPSTEKEDENQNEFSLQKGDIDIIIDPSKNKDQEIKHYGTKLVDVGGCIGLA
jgi:co-chaperonin GroES (HSP10)